MGRFCEGFNGFAGFGKVWAGLGGLKGWGGVGTVYEDLGGFGKNSENLKGLGQFGEVWKDLEAFGNAKIMELSPKTTSWESLGKFGNI